MLKEGELKKFFYNIGPGIGFEQQKNFFFSKQKEVFIFIYIYLSSFETNISSAHVVKKRFFSSLMLWAQCFKTFLSVIYEFSLKTRVFVTIGWKGLLGTNTVAYNANP
jgi:hypothetical protein